MPIARFGNTAALDRGQIMPGNQITTVQILDENDLSTRMRTITHQDGLWPRMSVEPAAWVECNDPALEKALARYFNCPIGEPTNWLDSEDTWKG